jgi:hypothetical protein
VCARAKTNYEGDPGQRSRRSRAPAFEFNASNRTVLDPFGQKWTIATHVEDVSPEEMQKRAAALLGAK